MKKLLITNVAYGDVYSDLFLEQHLKSFLDETNIPFFSDRVEYMIFTDRETIPKIQAHKNFRDLQSIVKVDTGIFDFPENVDKFNHRYSILINTFKWSVEKALERESYLSCLVADLVVAKDYMSKIFQRLDEGYDSVFVQPPRSAMERMVQQLPAEGALNSLDLWKLCYENMHPLWVACHWDAPQFSKLPFTLLWNSGRGLLARSFSITPIAFTPIPEMLKCAQVIDVEVPHMCKNPYWAHDWIECPILGVEPLQCYYPPFKNEASSVKSVKEWARCLHPSQWKFLEHYLYYPDRYTCREYVDSASEEIVQEILS